MYYHMVSVMALIFHYRNNNKLNKQSIIQMHRGLKRL